MRIKSITIVSLLVVLMLAFGALFINFVMAPNVFEFADRNRELEGQIGDSLISIKLPISVLRNIMTQVQDNDQALENPKLRKAYDSNQRTIIETSTWIMRDLEYLKASLTDMNAVLFDPQSLELDKGIAEIDDMLTSTRKLYELAYGSQMSSLKVEAIDRTYERLQTSFEVIIGSYKAINSRVVADMTMLLNTMFLLLISALILFGTGVLWFVHFQLPYISKSIKVISSHQYNRYKPSRFKPIFVEEKAIQTQIEEVIEENRFIEDVRELLLGTYLMDDAMEALFKLLEKRMGIDRIGIAFVDYDDEKIFAQYGVVRYGHILLGPGFETTFEKTSLKELLNTHKAMITPDLEAAYALKPNSNALKLLIAEGVKSNIILPMTMGSAVFGFLFLSSDQKHYFTDDMMHLAEKIVYEIKGLLNRSYFTKVIFSKITNSFSELVDQKDNETGDHIHRMVSYSVTLAKGLLKEKRPGYDIDQKFIQELEQNASSHDIGKVGIPDHILKKPGKLTSEEWEIMKTHSEIGSKVFRDLREGLKVFDPDFYRMAEEIAHYHHERWDGTGYPEGLSGEAIPLAARIVAVADVFDALTSRRVYKEAFSIDHSLRIIKESSGNHLDPVLVALFFDHQEEMLDIMKAGY